MTPRRVGDYSIGDEIGAGGMARVFVGRSRGDLGFARTVAIKTIHDDYAADQSFVSSFVDEARLASRIHHANVVGILDVIAEGRSVFLVLEYIHGETLAHLMARSQREHTAIPMAIAAAAVRDLLRGLHAAHEATAEDGTPLGIVHRDVSPHNVIVGADGSARLFDFGVAKAIGRLQTTRDGAIKGKLRYMAPEQLKNEPIDRRADVFAAAVILWELLAGRPLFAADSEAQVLASVLYGALEAPSTFRDGIPPELDAVVMRGLARQRDQRFATAAEMAAALERAVECAEPDAVSRLVTTLAAENLARRSALVARAERAVMPDASTVAVAREQPPTPPAGQKSARRWPAIALAAAAALVALIAVARFHRAPIAPPPADTRSAAAPTPPPPTPSEEIAAPTTAPRSDPPHAVPAAPRPAAGARAPLKRVSSPSTHAAPASHPCPFVIVDDGGIHRYNRDCLQ